MNKYNAGARLVFHFAREGCENLGHAAVNPEHLLPGLLRVRGTASRVLSDVGVTLGDAHRLTEEMSAMTGRGARSAGNETAAITPRARRVMELAALEAERLGSKRICTEHILLGIIREGNGVGYRVLEGLIKDPEIVRRRILEAALPDETSGEVPKHLHFNPGGWDETYLGVDKLSSVTELKLRLRLLGRGTRHLLLGC